MKSEYEESIVQRKNDSAAVELDQSRQGRLSRMDAMQQQAQMQAAMRRATQQLARIDAALHRLDRGEYGYCQACEEPISIARLTADPCALMCRGCAEEQEAERNRSRHRGR